MLRVMRSILAAPPDSTEPPKQHPNGNRGDLERF
jgi:hypothetical protein